MDQQAKVRISVEDEALRRLSDSAMNFYKKVSEQSKSQYRSTVEQNREIERQIQLIEKRARQEFNEARSRLKYAYQNDFIKNREFQSGNSIAEREYRKAQMFSSYVRDFYNKETSRGTVEYVRGVSGIQGSIDERARSLYNQIIRGGDGTTSFFESQLRNRKAGISEEQTSRVLDLRSQLFEGKINSRQAAEETKNIQRETQYQKAVLSRLEAIYRENKSQAKEQASELVKRLHISGKSDAENWIKKIESKAPSSDPIVNLRRREAVENIRATYGVGGGRGGNIASTAALAAVGSGGFLNGIAKANPIVMTATAILGAIAYTFKRQNDVALAGRRVSAFSGGDYHVALDRARSLYNTDKLNAMGLNMKEGLGALGEYMYQSGSTNITDDQVLRALGAQKSLGLSGSQISDAFRLQRFSRGRATGVGIIRNFNDYVQRAQGNPILLPEYLDLYKQLAEQQIGIAGSYNARNTSSLIQNLGDLTGANGPLLSALALGLQSTGTGGSNVVQAMKMMAVNRVNPNAGYFDAMRMMENPLENLDYISALLQQNKRLSGGSRDVEGMQLKELLPNLSYSQINTLMGIKDFSDLSKIRGVLTDEGGDRYIEGGKRMTTDYEWGSAMVENGLDNMSIKIAEVGESLIEKIQEVIDLMKGKKGEETAIKIGNTLYERIPHMYR